MDDKEIIREFLIESNENLARLDQEMVELEHRPKDPQLIASIFRTIHTIKGTCGFLGLSKLEAITHLAENLLSQVRDGKRELTSSVVTLVLEAVDATKRMLARIEAGGDEGEDIHAAVRARLEAACGSLPQNAPAHPQIAAPPTSLDDENGAGQKTTASVYDSTIRVDVALLDKLMNLVGELVLARNQIMQFNAQLGGTALNATSQRLNQITAELQESIMKTRMQPIGVLWNILPRMVRDLATSFGKEIELEIDGAGTELDKTILEAIKDPLTHLVRNCCDHGIEKPDVRFLNGKPLHGKITLRAYHEGGQVNIDIGDDGAGVDIRQLKNAAAQKGLVPPEQLERMSDRDALNLIFLPGLSTAEKVTNVSGRGVGMDVVKTNIEKIGGVVDLVSRRGEGTTVRVKIPLTLAIIPGLVVTSCGDTFVIPQVSLLELIRLDGVDGGKQIELIHGAPVYRRRGKLLPLAYLHELLQSPRAKPLSDIVNIVVLNAGDRQFGLVVDGIGDTQEIVVRSLGRELQGIACYAGATIMGDGRVALILDALGIGQLSGVMRESLEPAKTGPEPGGRIPNQRQTFLLFRSGSFRRLSIPLSQVTRLEEVPQSKIEDGGGGRVVRYRGQILPLTSLGYTLEPGAPDTASFKDPAQVIILNKGARSTGILVDEILDIVDDIVDETAPHAAPRKGLLGSAIIGNKVTDLVDLQAIA